MVGFFRCYLQADPLLIAPIGIAATHILGQTAWCLGLPVYETGGVGFRKYKSLDEYQKRAYVLKLTKGLVIVICDEISMLSSDNMAYIERRFREANASSNCMGSVRVFIRVGDLRQLPPVQQRWMFEPITPRCRSALGLSSDDKTWKTRVKLLEIPGSIRQHGDRFSRLSQVHL